MQLDKTLASLRSEPLAVVKKCAIAGSCLIGYGSDETGLDESYNRESDILAKIAEVSPQFPALVLDAREKWKAQELLEITYSCSPVVLV